MHTVRGSCRCGNLAFSLSLPRAIDGYTARRCDCDFCTRQGMDYLSDPEGAIELTFIDEPERLVQGDRMAHFLRCTRCGQVAAVLLDQDPAPIGAVNARLLQPNPGIESQPVSPRLLSAEQKRERWRTIWSPLRLARRPD